MRGRAGGGSGRGYDRRDGIGGWQRVVGRVGAWRDCDRHRRAGASVGQRGRVGRGASHVTHQAAGTRTDEVAAAEQDVADAVLHELSVDRAGGGGSRRRDGGRGRRAVQGEYLGAAVKAAVAAGLKVAVQEEI